mmetsp:Transcript_19442/g.66090  ORF Transcript_19442/g.66090 Transcript_19442/m.66090 type:complete len:346 (+) Transcript_19442:3560-4597(+)
MDVLLSARRGCKIDHRAHVLEVYPADHPELPVAFPFAAAAGGRPVVTGSAATLKGFESWTQRIVAVPVRSGGTRWLLALGRALLRLPLQICFPLLLHLFALQEAREWLGLGLRTPRGCVEVGGDEVVEDSSVELLQQVLACCHWQLAVRRRTLHAEALHKEPEAHTGVRPVHEHDALAAHRAQTEQRHHGQQLVLRGDAHDKVLYGAGKCLRGWLVRAACIRSPVACGALQVQHLRVVQDQRLKLCNRRPTSRGAQEPLRAPRRALRHRAQVDFVSVRQQQVGLVQHQSLRGEPRQQTLGQRPSQPRRGAHQQVGCGGARGAERGRGRGRRRQHSGSDGATGGAT